MYHIPEIGKKCLYYIQSSKIIMKIYFTNWLWKQRHLTFTLSPLLVHPMWFSVFCTKQCFSLEECKVILTSQVQAFIRNSPESSLNEFSLSVLTLYSSTIGLFPRAFYHKAMMKGTYFWKQNKTILVRTRKMVLFLELLHTSFYFSIEFHLDFLTLFSCCIFNEITLNSFISFSVV